MFRVIYDTNVAIIEKLPTFMDVLARTCVCDVCVLVRFPRSDISEENILLQ